MKSAERNDEKARKKNRANTLASSFPHFYSRKGMKDSLIRPRFILHAIDEGQLCTIMLIYDQM